jgi:FixJ family two-component response regulator
MPVVFITAHGSEEAVRSRALADGAVAFLSKPLSDDALLDAVRKALGSN